MIQHLFNWREIILKDQRLVPGEKYIGLILSTYMNGKHDFAFPSIATLCGVSGYSNRVVIKHLQGLEEKGYLAKQKRFGTSTIYYALLPESLRDLKVDFYSSDETSQLTNGHHSSDETSLAVVTKRHTNKQENNQKNKQESKFTEFWSCYPKKVDKKKAQTAFNRLTIAEQEKAITDIKSGRFNETPKQYIPNPTTYINGERWDDDTGTQVAQGVNWK